MKGKDSGCQYSLTAFSVNTPSGYAEWGYKIIFFLSML